MKKLPFLLLFLVIISAGCAQKSVKSNDVKDCGTNGQCFSEAFRTCAKAAMTVSLNSDVVQAYEILGLQAGRCAIKTQYIKNVSPDLTGKEGVCLYDNSLSYEAATLQLIQDSRISGYCSGSLYDAIKEMTHRE